MAGSSPPLNEGNFLAIIGVKIMKKRELDNRLDEIIAQIRSEQIEDTAAKEASDRVRSRMNGASMLADRSQDAGAQMGAPARIEGCSDFQSLIPAYLGGQLSEARALLLVQSAIGRVGAGEMADDCSPSDASLH